MPLVASLPDSERIRLLRWIASPHGADASAYRAAPPTDDEFSGDDEPLAWEADGWEEFHRLGAGAGKHFDSPINTVRFWYSPATSTV